MILPQNPSDDHNHGFIGAVHELTCLFCDDILTDHPIIIYKPIGPEARESVNSRLLFFLLVLIPYAGYRVVIGYGDGVTLLVTPPQATTKIMVEMAERRNGR